MEYKSGMIGRLFFIRFDHGDDILSNLKQLIIKEGIKCGWFQFFGGLAKADVVIGPKEPTVPPDPVWQNINETREVMGTGSIFWDEKEPLLHMHAAMGHHGKTLTGCVRKQAEVYLVVEAVVYEITGMEVTRPWFPEGGFNRPTILD